MSEALSSPAPVQRPGTSAGAISLWLLAAALVGLPWSYRVEWDSNRVAVLTFVPALVAGWRLVGRSANEFLRASPVIAGAALIFGASILVATAQTNHLAASIVAAAGWTLTALVALLVRQQIRENARATLRLAGALALSGALATALHWLRWRSGEHIQTAFYVYYRLMGLHALGSAFAAVVMVYHTRTAPLASRLIWVVVGIVAWGGLLWTGSRSPLIGLGVGLALWWILFRGAGRARLAGCVALLALSGLAVSYAFYSPDRGIGWWHVWERSVPTQDAKTLTSNRSDFWAGAADHVAASPWFGYGPDAYGFLTPPLEGAQPHNVVLQVLLDVGAVGALALLGLVIVVLWRAAQTPPAGEGVPREWLGLAVASLVSGQLDGYFFYPLALLPSVVAFGACAAAVARPAVEDRGAFALAAGASLATAVLAFHVWLFQQVVHRPAPATPDALVARAWRIFPSATYNVDFWIDAWEKPFPAEALAISRLASRNAQAPDFFRVKTALILARRGEHRAAIAELERAHAEAGPAHRPVIEKLLASARAAAQ